MPYEEKQNGPICHNQQKEKIHSLLNSLNIRLTPCCISATEINCLSVCAFQLNPFKTVSIRPNGNSRITSLALLFFGRRALVYKWREGLSTA